MQPSFTSAASVEGAGEKQAGASQETWLHLWTSPECKLQP